MRGSTTVVVLRVLMVVVVEVVELYWGKSVEKGEEHK